MKIDLKIILIVGIVAGLLIMALEPAEIFCWPVDVLFLFLAGIVSVHFMSNKSGDRLTAAVHGALAGLIAGGFGGVLYNIRKYFDDLQLQATAGAAYNATYRKIVGSGTPMTPDQFLVADFLCCLPLLIVTGLALGAFGGVIYNEMRKVRL